MVQDESEEIDGIILLDRNLDIVASKNKNQNTVISVENIGEITSLVHKENKGYDIVQIDGNNRYVGVNQLENGFVVIVYCDEATVLRPIEDTRKELIIVSGLVIILASIVAIVLAKTISNPITYMIDDLLLMGQGNFTGTRYKKYRKKSDEIGKLALTIENIQTAIGAMISLVHKNRMEVGNTVVTLEEVVDKLMLQTSNVTEITNDLCASMEEISATADCLNERSETMKEKLSQVKEKNYTGMDEMSLMSRDAENQNMKIEEYANTSQEVTNKIIQRLESSITSAKQVEMIRGLTESILSITDETNLLAINASIEAARVGEVGKGFTVIAQEIYKLSEQSQKTATGINRIVDEVINAVTELSSNAEEALSYMSNLIVSNTNNFIDTSKQYSDGCIHSQQIFETCASLSNEVVEEVEVMVQSFDELRCVTESNSKGFETLVEDASNLSRMAEQVREQSVCMGMVFEQLDSAINNFVYKKGEGI